MEGVSKTMKILVISSPRLGFELTECKSFVLSLSKPIEVSYIKV
jgi:hypothetical protein